MNPVLYKCLLWKNYVMTGYSLTQLFKYAIMAFGMWEITGGRNIKVLILIGIAYIIFCFILGWIWYRFGLVNAEREIGNQYDPFAHQIRDLFVLPKNIKSIENYKAYG